MHEYVIYRKQTALKIVIEEGLNNNIYFKFEIAAKDPTSENEENPRFLWKEKVSVSFSLEELGKIGLSLQTYGGFPFSFFHTIGENSKKGGFSIYRDNLIYSCTHNENQKLSISISKQDTYVMSKLVDRAILLKTEIIKQPMASRVSACNP